MANWQAPSTNNERAPDDVGLLVQQRVRVYLDPVTGRVKWWQGNALPVGAVPYFITVRAADARRVVSDDSTDERAPVLFGASKILFR